MKTVSTPIAELYPGNKVFVARPENAAIWNKMPEILTVKQILVGEGKVLIKETGGLCLVASELQKIVDLPEPKEGDLITFSIEVLNAAGLRGFSKKQAVVKEVVFDEEKKQEPIYIVFLEDQEHQVPLERITQFESNPTPDQHQLSMF